MLPWPTVRSTKPRPSFLELQHDHHQTSSPPKKEKTEVEFRLNLKSRNYKQHICTMIRLRKLGDLDQSEEQDKEHDS
jgi:hypothetical protein